MKRHVKDCIDYGIKIALSALFAGIVTTTACTCIEQVGPTPHLAIAGLVATVLITMVAFRK